MVITHNEGPSAPFQSHLPRHFPGSRARRREASAADPASHWHGSKPQGRAFSFDSSVNESCFFTSTNGTQNLHKPQRIDGEWMINDEWHVLNKAVWNWDLLKTPCIFSWGTMSVLCVQVTGGVAILTWDDRGLDAFSGWNVVVLTVDPTGDYINLWLTTLEKKH